MATRGRKISHSFNLLKDVFDDGGKKREEFQRIRTFTWTCLDFASISCHDPQLGKGEQDSNSNQISLTCTGCVYLLLYVQAESITRYPNLIYL